MAARARHAVVNSLAAVLKRRARDKISLVTYLIEPAMCEMSPFQHVINIKCSERAVLSFLWAQCGKARPPLTLGASLPRDWPNSRCTTPPPPGRLSIPLPWTGERGALPELKAAAQLLLSQGSPAALRLTPAVHLPAHPPTPSSKGLPSPAALPRPLSLSLTVPPVPASPPLS